MSAALAEAPKPPYHVDPVLVLTCIVVILGLVVGGFALFYIFNRIHRSLQNKILDELDDLEAQTFKPVSIIPPPLSRASTRKSASTGLCRAVDSPTVKYEKAVRRAPIRLLYPHPAPRVVPILPTVPQPVHSPSSAYAPTPQHLSYFPCLPDISQAAESIDHASGCDSIFENDRNIFSIVADTIVGVYPVSIVHPVVKTYEIHTCQLPRSSVLGAIINTLDSFPALVSTPTPERTILLLFTNPTLALTPPSPEKPSVLRARDLNSTTAPVSPAPGLKNVRGAESGMHRFRRAKRKENRPPIVLGAHL